MSPRRRGWILAASFVVLLPALIFAFVVAIESLAGSQGSEGVFGSTLDAWRSQVNAAIIFGPSAAFALVVLGSAHVRRERRGGRVHAILVLDMTQRIAAVAVILGLTTAAVIGYVLSRAGLGSLGS